VVGRVLVWQDGSWASGTLLLDAAVSRMRIAEAYPSRMLSTRWTIAIALVVTVAALAIGARVVRRAFPPINDISTDTDDPPRFVDILPLRAASRSRSEHGGPAVAAMQRAAYPDIAPAQLSTTPAEAFARARAAANEMGWEIVSADSAAGRIEATATTPVFRFRDDIVIRVRTHSRGVRVDIRSASRVGRGDLGANARRIRGFVAHLNG
jgi:uncharacterized protein (DUF1499 family)